VSTPIIKADRLPLFDRNHEVLCYVSKWAAQIGLRDGRYIGVGTKNYTRGLVLSGEFDTSKVTRITDYVGQSYSHKHVAKDNPEGVWTLKRLPAKVLPIFRTVVTSCVVSPAREYEIFKAA
jgi:hypothetical protein